MMINGTMNTCIVWRYIAGNVVVDVESDETEVLWINFLIRKDKDWMFGDLQFVVQNKA
jgi:hypothetical protein